MENVYSTGSSWIAAAMNMLPYVGSYDHDMDLQPDTASVTFLSDRNVDFVMNRLQRMRNARGLHRIGRAEVVARMIRYDSSVIAAEDKNNPRVALAGLPWSMSYHRQQFLRKNQDLWRGGFEGYNKAPRNMFSPQDFHAMDIEDPEEDYYLNNGGPQPKRCKGIYNPYERAKYKRHIDRKPDGIEGRSLVAFQHGILHTDKKTRYEEMQQELYG
jgi:hypothetical protein